MCQHFYYMIIPKEERHNLFGKKEEKRYLAVIDMNDNVYVSLIAYLLKYKCNCGVQCWIFMK